MALPNFLTLLNHLTKLALDSLYAITYLGNILIVFLIIPMIDFSDLWKLKSSRCHADWILFLQTKCFFVCQHQKFTILFQRKPPSCLAFIFFGRVGTLSPSPMNWGRRRQQIFGRLLYVFSGFLTHHRQKHFLRHIGKQYTVAPIKLIFHPQKIKR